MTDPIKASAQTTLDYIDQKIEELIAARLTLIRTFGLNDISQESPPQAGPATAPEAKDDAKAKEPVTMARASIQGPRPSLGILAAHNDGGNGKPRRPKIESQHILLQAIVEHGPKSGTELAILTGINQPGIYAILGHEWFEKEADGYHVSAAGHTELQLMKARAK